MQHQLDLMDKPLFPGLGQLAVRAKNTAKSAATRLIAPQGRKLALLATTAPFLMGIDGNTMSHYLYGALGLVTCMGIGYGLSTVYFTPPPARTCAGKSEIHDENTCEAWTKAFSTHGRQVERNIHRAYTKAQNMASSFEKLSKHNQADCIQELWAQYKANSTTDPRHRFANAYTAGMPAFALRFIAQRNPEAFAPQTIKQMIRLAQPTRKQLCDFVWLPKNRPAKGS